MHPLQQSNAPAELGKKKLVSTHGSKQCRFQTSEQIFEEQEMHTAHFDTSCKQKVVVDDVHLTPGGSGVSLGFSLLFQDICWMVYDLN